MLLLESWKFSLESSEWILLLGLAGSREVLRLLLESAELLLLGEVSSSSFLLASFFSFLSSLFSLGSSLFCLDLPGGERTSGELGGLA